MSKEDINRKKPRFTVKMSGYYLIENQWEKCVVYDVNLEGAALNIDQDFEVNVPVKIRLKNKEKEIIFNCMLVNKNHQRAGVKFIKISEEEKAFISEIINLYSNRFQIVK